MAEQTATRTKRPPTTAELVKLTLDEDLHQSLEIIVTHLQGIETTLELVGNKLVSVDTHLEHLESIARGNRAKREQPEALTIQQMAAENARRPPTSAPVDAQQTPPRTDMVADATPKQAAAIRSIATDRGVTPGLLADWLMKNFGVEAADQLSKAEASAAIDALKKLPRPQTPEEEADDDYYR